MRRIAQLAWVFSAACVATRELDLPETTGDERALVLAIDPDTRASLAIDVHVYAFDLDSPERFASTIALGPDAVFNAFVYTRTLDQLGLEAGELVPITEGASRAIPPGERTLRRPRDGAWSPINAPDPAIAAFRIADSDPATCFTSGGCFVDERCEDPCPAPDEPMPPAGPDAPEAVEPFPCPTGWNPRAPSTTGVIACAPPPRVACTATATAQFPGDTSCSPIGAPCPMGEFSDHLPGGTVVFVDPAAPAGGDGSRSAPVRTIAEAFAIDAATIALAKGDYPQPILITAPRSIIGACAAETRLGDVNVATSSVALEDLRFHELAVSGSATLRGLLVDRQLTVAGTAEGRHLVAPLVISGTASVSDVVAQRIQVHGGHLALQRATAEWIYVDGGSAAIRAASFAGGTGAGAVYAVNDATISIANSAVSGMFDGARTETDGSITVQHVSFAVGSTAIHALSGRITARSFLVEDSRDGIHAEDGAVVSASHGAVEHYVSYGATAQAAKLDLEHVRFIGPGVPEGELGVAISYTGGADGMLSHITIVASPQSGLFAKDPETTVVAQHLEIHGRGGRGNDNGVVVVEHANVAIQRLNVDGCAMSGVLIGASGHAILMDTRIARSDFGGIFLAHGATLDAAKTAIESCGGYGVQAYTTALMDEPIAGTFTDLTIEDTRPIAPNNDHGHPAASGSGISAEGESTLAVRRFRISRSAGEGAYAGQEVDRISPVLELEHGRIEGSPYGARLISTLLDERKVFDGVMIEASVAAISRE